MHKTEDGKLLENWFMVSDKNPCSPFIRTETLGIALYCSQTNDVQVYICVTILLQYLQSKSQQALKEEFGSMKNVYGILSWE